GGFLFGAYSTVEKLTNGALILSIQAWKQTSCPPTSLPTAASSSCGLLLRRVLVFLPPTAVLVAIAACYALAPSSSGLEDAPHRDRAGPYKYIRVKSRVGGDVNIDILFFQFSQVWSCMCLLYTFST
ncbi:hypothetical protein NGA_0353700, partial [Nannochloropsis gaditana CCMP526]|uniref:uncharacterized protein n=1 Tax=Nannochloropsis gaditana (strain CCMP526) TaxID=1093141 RepID=UPI00029F7BFB